MLAVIELKKSQLTIEMQAVGTGFIPKHKFKANFIDYFEEYVKLNRRKGNRHLENSLKQFRAFVETDFIAPVDITYNFCKRFRQYLLDKYRGETPGNYYARFKWVLNAATRDEYYRVNPTENIVSKSNPSARLKEFLEVEEYIELLKTPCLNREVQEAFILSFYTGLRWADVKKLQWKDITGSVLVTRIIQQKTGFPVTLTLHPIARAILRRRENQFRAMKVFDEEGTVCHRFLKLYYS
jgi:integrase